MLVAYKYCYTIDNISPNLFYKLNYYRVSSSEMSLNLISVTTALNYALSTIRYTLFILCLYNQFLFNQATLALSEY